MNVDETRKVLDAYMHDHDTSVVASDAVFTDTASGERYEGREAIDEMLHYVYEVGLTAEAEIKRVIVGEGAAALEADVVGTHSGDFGGIPATGKQVRIPLAVTYTIEDGLITEGTVYMQFVQFLQQVGAV